MTATGEGRSARAPGPRPRFFVIMGCLALVVALVGFARTFFAPMAAGTFQAPLVIYIHGACAFAWIIIFAIQPLLIHARKFGEHRRLGFASLAVAAGFAVTTLPAGAYAAARDFANGGGETAISGLVGYLTSALIFAGLVLAGVLTRKTPETHNRLMLLATIAALWPAWFRFRHYFPDVPRPDIVFAVVLADSLVILAALRDFVVLRRIHPVWLVCGTGLILEHVAELFLFDSAPWRALARALYQLFVP